MNFEGFTPKNTEEKDKKELPGAERVKLEIERELLLDKIFTIENELQNTSNLNIPKKILLRKEIQRLEKVVEYITVCIKNGNKTIEAMITHGGEDIQSKLEEGKKLYDEEKRRDEEKKNEERVKKYEGKSIAEIMKILDAEEKDVYEKVKELPQNKQSIFRTFKKWTQKLSFNVKAISALSIIVAGGVVAYDISSEKSEGLKPNQITSSTNQKMNDVSPKYINYNRPEAESVNKVNKEAILKKGEGPEHPIIRQIMNDASLAKKLGWKEGEDIEKFAGIKAHKIYLENKQYIKGRNFKADKDFFYIVVNELTGKITLVTQKSSSNDSKKMIQNKFPVISRQGVILNLPEKQNTYSSSFDTKKPTEEEKSLQSKEEMTMTLSQAEVIVNNITDGTIVIYKNKEYEVGLPLTKSYGRRNFRLFTGRINNNGIRTSINKSQKSFTKLIQSGEITLKQEQPKTKNVRNENLTKPEQSLEEKTNIAEKKLDEFITKNGWGKLVEKSFNDIGTVEETVTEAQKQEFKNFVTLMMKYGYRKAVFNEKLKNTESIKELLTDCVQIMIEDNKESELYKILQVK